MAFLADNVGDIAAAMKKIKEDEAAARGEIAKKAEDKPSTHTGSGGGVSNMNPASLPPGYLGFYKEPADCGQVGPGGIH